MKKRILISGWMVLLLLLVFPLPLQAQGGERGEAGRVLFGSNLTLEEGDLIDGDVVIFGGNFEMKAGSEVKGDVVVFGGNVTINGEVKGDIAAIGGNVEVQDDAVVKGDIAGLGGQVRVAEGADVSGSVATGPQVQGKEGGFSIEIPSLPRFSATPKPPPIPVPTVVPRMDFRPESRASFVARVGNFLGDGIEDLFAALVIAGLGMLVALFFPAHTRTVEQTLTDAAPTSFVLGVVTLLAAGALMVVLGIFFFLILPICGVIFVALALAAALLMGMTVIGKAMGERLFARLNVAASSELSATLLGVGVLVLLIRMPFVDHLPLIGWMFGLAGGVIGFLVASTGVGAVVLSRFGTQAYHGEGAPILPERTPPAGDESL